MEGKGSEAEFKVIESVVIIPKALTAIQFRHNPRSQWKEYAPLLRDYASVALCLASFAADACSLYDERRLSKEHEASIHAHARVRLSVSKEPWYNGDILQRPLLCSFSLMPWVESHQNRSIVVRAVGGVD